jgi:N-acetylglucosamine kinase-like BadF-type ATPase
MVYGRDVLSHLAGPYVVGIDAGGTTTRCAVVSLGGSVVSYATGPGANRNSGGDTATALAQALRSALGDIDPMRVIGGVFGIAGAGAAGRPAAVSAANTAWHSIGLPGAPHVVTDIAVAFAAATPAPAGVIVFAGTGAGAAVVNDGTIVRRADGYGWLVGDEGSAVWLGREGVRAALAAYDGRGASTTLADTIPRALLGDGATTVMPINIGAMSSRSALPQAIVREVYRRPPTALGQLAPLVSAAATSGDKVAERIVSEAAEWLLTDVDAVRPALVQFAATGRPVVTAGSLLVEGPVADAVRAGLRERFDTEPVMARDGARGAARLALRRLDPAGVSPLSAICR